MPTWNEDANFWSDGLGSSDSVPIWFHKAALENCGITPACAAYHTFADLPSFTQAELTARIVIGGIVMHDPDPTKNGVWYLADDLTWERRFMQSESASETITVMNSPEYVPTQVGAIADGETVGDLAARITDFGNAVHANALPVKSAVEIIVTGTGIVGAKFHYWVGLAEPTHGPHFFQSPDVKKQEVPT